MKKYKAILFDVDGTLIDSYLGVAGGVKHTLDRYGIPYEPDATFHHFIGPPLIESFERSYGFSRDRMLELETVFREYYDARGIYENELYDGVREVLSAARRTGRLIATASSKPRSQVVEILKHHGIDSCFDYVGAAIHEEGIVEKEDVVRKLLSDTALSAQDCLLIGDRLYDVVGAHGIGMDCAYVLYGFGSRSEAEQYGADYIIEDTRALERFVSEL